MSPSRQTMLIKSLGNAFDYKKYLIANVYGGTGDNVRDIFVKALQNSSKPHPTPTDQVITPQNSEEIAVMNEYYLFLWKYYVLEEEPKEEPKIEEPLIERINLSEGPKINEEKLFTTPEESQRREFEFEGETKPIPSGISAGDIIPVDIEELEPRVESEKTTEIVEKVVEKIKVEKLLETEVETIVEKEPVVNNISQKFFSEENLDNLVNEIRNDDVVIEKISTEIVSDAKEEIKKDTGLDDESLDSLLSEIRNEDVVTDSSLRPVEVVSGDINESSLRPVEVVSDEEITSVDDPEKIAEVLETTKEQIREEVKEEVREEVKDDLDRLLEQIREETAKEREEESKKQKIDTTKLLAPARDDNEKVLDKLQETNKNLLSINEQLYNLNLGLKKSIIDEKRRLFKQRDRERKSVRRGSFLSKPRRGGGRRSGGIKPEETTGGIFDFLLYSVLAGLVDYIPKLVETVENFANNVREFFEDLPYNIGRSIGNAVQRIQEFIDGIREKFGPKIEEIKDTVLTFFEETKERVLEAFDNIYKSIDDFTGGKLTEFVNMLKNTGTFLKDQAGNLYNAIDDFTGGKLTDTKNFISDKVITPMKTFFSEQLQSLTSGVTGLFDKAKEGFLNLVPQEMKDGFRDSFLEGPDLSGDVVTMGDSIAVGVRGAQGVSADTSMAREGAGTKEILGNIQREASAGNLQGKTLQLSSGITNTKGDTDTVREQLRAAKEGGATGVQLMGTANEGDYDQNAALKAIAEEDEFKDFVKFQGGFKAGGDAMHPESYSKLAGSLATTRQENIQSKKDKGGSISGSGASKGASIARKLQKDLNISPAAAAGVVGNLMLESGLQPDNVEDGKGFEDGPINNIPVGTERVGYGWGQWTGARLESFRKFLKSRGSDNKPATDKDNYDYLIQEIKTTEPLQNHWKTGTSIPQDDPEKAATWFMMNWERPSKPHQDRRQQYAKEIFEKIKGGNSKTPASGVTPRPSPRQVLDRRDAKLDPVTAPNIKPQTPVAERNSSGYAGRIKYFSSNGGGVNMPLQAGKSYSFSQLRLHHGEQQPRRQDGFPRDYTLLHGTNLQSSPNAEIPVPLDSVVTHRQSFGGYGQTVIVSNSTGNMLFAHLSKYGNFKVGDKIKAGTIVGTQGSTGGNYADHLHLDAEPSGHEAFINYITGGKPTYKTSPEPKTSPSPAAPSSLSAVTDPVSGVSKQIARPSGRRGTNITTMDLPGNAGQQMPVALPEKSGQVNNLPFVNTSYSDDVYKIHTRSVFNIVG